LGPPPRLCSPTDDRMYTYRLTDPLQILAYPFLPIGRSQIRLEHAIT
jgi:hypothetical protein